MLVWMSTLLYIYIYIYNKTTLQGENSNEDQFWQQEQPKPSIFLPEINK